MPEKIEKLSNEVKELESSHGEKSRELVPVLENLAYQLHCESKFEEAVDTYSRSLEIRLESLPQDSEGLLFVYHSLGILLRILNRFDESEVYYRKALKITMEEFGDQHIETATRQNYLAGLFYASGKLGDAEELVHSSLKIYRKHLGEDHRVVGVTLMALGIIMAKTGNLDDAKEYYQKASSLVSPVKQGAVIADFEDLADSMLNLSSQKLGQSKLEEAETLFRYSVLTEAEQVWPGHPIVAENVQLLGDLYKSQTMYSEAEFLFSKALEIRKQVFGEEHLDVAVSAHALGLVLCEIRKFKEAEPYLKLAVDIRSKAGFPPAYASSLSAYAKCLDKLNRLDEAKKLERKSAKILDDYRPQGLS